MVKNCRYGSNRVIEPKSSLPQAALKVDNTPEIHSNELLIDVNILNITSTAFSRIKRITGGDKQKIADEVKRIVEEKGKFQCPGCAGVGFSEQHPTCGILTCSQRKGIEFCHECDEFPCKKFDSWGDTDSFITHRNVLIDMEKAKRMGIEAYIIEQQEKVGILSELLEGYNDGRRKSFFCLAVNLLDLHDIITVMDQLDSTFSAEKHEKERATSAVRLFEEMAQQRGISLKKRKN